VPVSNRVGDENKGWTYAKYLLTHERVNIARLGESKRELRALKALATQCRSNGRPLIEDVRFRDRIADLEIDLLALEYTVLRVLSEEAAGRDPGPISSVLKIRGSELQQTLTELQMQALGPRALPWIPEALEAGWQGEPDGAQWWAACSGRYFNMRKTTIYSGSNEIQRNIISHRILGL
jgi:alkylation response protein AidB-like acyl-CoA dehydrogenase